MNRSANTQTLKFEEIFLPYDRNWSTGVLKNATGATLIIVASGASAAGSNTASHWMLWAGIIGLLGASHMVVGWRLSAPINRRYVWLVGLILVVPFFAAAQVFLLPGKVEIGVAALAIIRLLSYALFFVLALDVMDSNRRVAWMANLLVLAIAAHAVVGFMFPVPVAAVSSFAGMVSGGFVNHNSFATYLGIGLCFAVGHMLDQIARQSPVIRAQSIVSIAAVCIILIALLGTQSRMGIFATCAGALVVLTRIGRPRLVILGAVMAIALLGVVTVDRGVMLGTAAQVRWTLYQQVFDMIAARPFTGHGLDNFALAFEPFHKLPLSAAVVWNSAHSTYLSLWAELGIIVGSVPLVAGLIIANKLHSQLQWRSISALGALVVAAVHSLVDFSLEVEGVTLTFIFVIALGLSSVEKRQ